MSARKVLPITRRLTEDDARTLLGLGVSRLLKAHTASRVALEAGCDEKTVRNARAADTSLKLHTALNLLSLDPTALDELLAAYGFRLAPLTANAANDLHTISALAETASELARANADGVRDHSETLAVAELVRPLLPGLSNIVAEADRLRGGVVHG